MNTLTARQSQILDFIRAEIADRGRPPTVREIGNALGIRSTNGTRCHLLALEKKGAIKVDPLVSRGIRVLSQGETSPQRTGHWPGGIGC